MFRLLNRQAAMTIAAIGGMFESRFGRTSMRTNRQLDCLSVSFALVLPGLANANCYSIYDAKNQLVFQSTISPVDLSKRISESMRERFPGGHLIIDPNDRSCREVRTGSTLTPRFDAGGTRGAEARLDRSLEASPLLRGTGTIGSDASTR